MSKTLNLRRALQSTLQQVVGEDVAFFYEHADTNTSFPYVVYVIEYSGANYQVELNIYDKSSSTVAIETITDKVDDFFRHMTYTDEYQHFTTYLNARNNLDDESDKKIKRRRLLVDLEYFWKGM